MTQGYSGRSSYFVLLTLSKDELVTETLLLLASGQDVMQTVHKSLEPTNPNRGFEQDL